MNQISNELSGDWAFVSKTEFNSLLYIRFTKNGSLHWGYQNQWLTCNIPHNYWFENGSIATVCPPNPRKELTPFEITSDGKLKLKYLNRETIWERAETQQFFENKDIWNPGIPFPRQIDYMALLKEKPRNFQIERAKNLGISPQILVNTNALWKLHEYSQAEFASFHLDDFKFILEQGILVDEEDNMDATLLSHFAGDGYVEAVKLMLEFGFDINAKDITDNTPLDYALWKNQSDVAGILRENGAKTGKEIEK